MKRALILSSLLFLGIVFALIGWKFYKAGRGGPISARGGRTMTLMLPELGRTYLQGDPAWRNELLGQTQQKLGSAGCTVCSVAMAATSLGYPINPLELNARLRDAQGFTEEGWLIWGAVPKATGGKIEVVVTDRPSHAELDSALQRGEYPVVKFILFSSVPHWVVIVGKQGLDYLIRDPLMPADKPVTLTSRTDAIQSVRFIRRKAA